MNTRLIGYRAAVCAVAALYLGGCGDDLAPAWEIRAFRLFGAKIENLSRAAADPGVTEAAPGETVRLTLSYVDPGTMRDLNVTWVFCAQATVTGTSLGCAAGGLRVATGTTVEYEVPRIEYAVDAANRPRIQAVAMACAGGTVAIDPATMQPTCRGEGSASWVMTRSILVRTAETVPPNHNPALVEPLFIRSGLTTEGGVPLAADGSLRVPRCASDPCPEHTIELRLAPGSREQQPAFDLQGNRVMSQERIQFGFFTDKGTIDGAFRVDSSVMPDGPVRNRWAAPRAPGTARFFFTAQDNRGGFDVIERSIVVE